MKNVNSALAPKVILKSILFVMLVLVATFSVASYVASSPKSNEIGKNEYQEIPSELVDYQSAIGTSALAIGGRTSGGDIGGRSTTSSDYFTFDTRSRSNELGTGYSFAIGGRNGTTSTGEHYTTTIGGKVNELSKGYAFAIGGRNGTTSTGEHFYTPIGGRGTSTHGENCSSKSLDYEPS